MTEEEILGTIGTGIIIGVAIRSQIGTVGSQTTVGTAEREEGRETHGVVEQAHGAVGSLVAVRIAEGLLHIHNLGTHVQPLGHLGIRGKVGVVTLDIVVVCIAERGLFLVVTQADVVTGVTGVSCNTQVVLLLESGLEEFLVRIGNTIIVRRSIDDFPVTAIYIGLVQGLAGSGVEPGSDLVGHVLEIHTESLDIGTIGIQLGGNTFLQLGQDAFLVRDVLRKTHRRIPGEVVGIGNRCAVFHAGTVLARDEDHTESSTRTVDGSGSRILQHGDALDVVRVHEGEVRNLHTVEEDQRVAVSVHGTRTTDLHRRGFTQVIGGEGDRQTGDNALETLRHVRNRLAVESLVNIDRRNGTRQVDFLLRTETDDHDFIQEFVVFGKDNAQVRSGGDILGDITDAGNVQRRSGGSLDSEVTLSVRHGTRRRSFHDNAGTRNGIALGIHNRTRSTVLCIRRKAQQGEHHNCACSEHFVYLHRKQILVNNRVNNYFFRISIQ